jgi:hypothetical protein
MAQAVLTMDYGLGLPALLTKDGLKSAVLYSHFADKRRELSK